jgi:hypothetical protein
MRRTILWQRPRTDSHFGSVSDSKPGRRRRSVMKALQQPAANRDLEHCWRSFKRGAWCLGIDVRDFIVCNVTPFVGDERFLPGVPAVVREQFGRGGPDVGVRLAVVGQAAVGDGVQQFAGGSREQAQLVSKALQDKGYKIPGEERIGTAAGKHEVRYFYAGQKTVATQLATDTTQALQRLGYPSLSVSAVFAGDPTKSNPDGKLELWLEIPPK